VREGRGDTCERDARAVNVQRVARSVSV